MGKRNVVIHVDMDGVVAEWNKVASVEKTEQPFYFLLRRPDWRAIFSVILLFLAGYDVRIRSSVYKKERVKTEKTLWLWLHGLGFLKRFYVPYGSSKADGLETGKIHILLDDFTKNLMDWDAKENCIAVKYRNGINGTKGTWQGRSISRTRSSMEIAGYLKAVANTTV